MPKELETKYGIKITKPFSKEMYQHNDEVAHAMKSNMGQALSENYDKAMNEDGDHDVKLEAIGEKHLRDIGSAIEGVGYGDGYDLNDILQSALKSLDNMANWQLHEEYSYLCFKGIVPRTRFMMVGFDWEKHDYSFCTEADLSNSAVHNL